MRAYLILPFAFAIASLADDTCEGVSTNARCGSQFKFTCKGSIWGNCCSQYNYCGSSDAFCGKGCQPGCGDCSSSVQASSSTLVAPYSVSPLRSPSPVATPYSTTPSKEIPKDATCGGKNGWTCQGSKWGNCCSQYGWCGSSTPYCRVGCQPLFGTCHDTSSPSAAGYSVRPSKPSSGPNKPFPVGPSNPSSVAVDDCSTAQYVKASSVPSKPSSVPYSARPLTSTAPSYSTQSPSPSHVSYKQSSVKSSVLSSVKMDDCSTTQYSKASSVPSKPSSAPYPARPYSSMAQSSSVQSVQAYSVSPSSSSRPPSYPSMSPLVTPSASSSMVPSSSTLSSSSSRVAPSSPSMTPSSSSMIPSSSSSQSSTSSKPSSTSTMFSSSSSLKSSSMSSTVIVPSTTLVSSTSSTRASSSTSPSATCVPGPIAPPTQPCASGNGANGQFNSIITLPNKDQYGICQNTYWIVDNLADGTYVADPANAPTTCAEECSTDSQCLLVSYNTDEAGNCLPKFGFYSVEDYPGYDTAIKIYNGCGGSGSSSSSSSSVASPTQMSSSSSTRTSSLSSSRTPLSSSVSSSASSSAKPTPTPTPTPSSAPTCLGSGATCRTPTDCCAGYSCQIKDAGFQCVAGQSPSPTPPTSSTSAASSTHTAVSSRRF